MFWPDTKIFSEEIAAWKPVVPGALEKGEFMGLPRVEAKPPDAAVNEDVKLAFAEPLMVEAICGTMSKYRGRDTPLVRI